jgi:hypothetical protein
MAPFVGGTDLAGALVAPADHPDASRDVDADHIPVDGMTEKLLQGAEDFACCRDGEARIAQPVAEVADAACCQLGKPDIADATVEFLEARRTNLALMTLRIAADVIADMAIKGIVVVAAHASAALTAPLTICEKADGDVPRAGGIFATPVCPKSALSEKCPSEGLSPHKFSELFQSVIWWAHQGSNLPDD